MYSITKQNNSISYGIKEFVCDTEEDLQNLPDCDMGSSAIVIKPAGVYLKNSQDEWIKV